MSRLWHIAPSPSTLNSYHGHYHDNGGNYDDDDGNDDDDDGKDDDDNMDKPVQTQVAALRHDGDDHDHDGVDDHDNQDLDHDKDKT